MSTSGSVRKDRFSTIGIHKVPVGVSKKDFEAKVDALMDALSATPIAQKNFLTFKLILQKDGLDPYIKALGVPAAQPAVVIAAECQIAEHQAEIFGDAEVKKLLADAELWDFNANSCVFSAEVTTRIDVATANPMDRICAICVSKVPAHMSPTEFQEKMVELIDCWLKIPVCQQNVLKHTLWLQNDTMGPSVRALNYGTEACVVAMIECESWDHLLNVSIPRVKFFVDLRPVQVVTDGEHARVVTKLMQDFPFQADSNAFLAETVVKVDGA
ncbi:hypothetical protein B0H19DRAFT_1129180 [Mycena capillaripes]|nr:hypothetical protein B0H19DRAFT_1129180 [Mycena capillaripes]